MLSHYPAREYPAQESPSQEPRESKQEKAFFQDKRK